MDFPTAFTELMRHEGGYVDDHRDPGGLTKYGISARQYPTEDIRNLTIARAREIYRRDYWGPGGCEALPSAVRYAHFDLAVNSGIGTAVKVLQRAAGQVPDGQLGPLTMQAVNSMPSSRLLGRMCGERLVLLASLPHFVTYGRGWTRRVAAILQAA